MPQLIYHYKSTIERKYWENYLERRLTYEERAILENARGEKKTNEKIKAIFNRAREKNLYIPELTELKGNCMFETLKYHDLCENIEDLRRAVAWSMHIFRSTRGFIPCEDSSTPIEQQPTLMEIFDMQNEVEYIFWKEKIALIKYNYSVMCRDINTDTSWSRLPTELIFRTLSVLYNLRFLILHDNGHTTIIESIVDENTININMALLGEFHYIPLQYRHGHDYEDDCPKYRESLRDFHNWARTMAESVGKVEEIEQEEQEEEEPIFQNNIIFTDVKPIEIDTDSFVDF